MDSQLTYELTALFRRLISFLLKLPALILQGLQTIQLKAPPNYWQSGRNKALQNLMVLRRIWSVYTM